MNIVRSPSRPRTFSATTTRPLTMDHERMNEQEQYRQSSSSHAGTNGPSLFESTAIFVLFLVLSFRLLGCAAFAILLFVHFRYPGHVRIRYACLVLLPIIFLLPIDVRLPSSRGHRGASVSFVRLVRAYPASHATLHLLLKREGEVYLLHGINPPRWVISVDFTRVLKKRGQGVPG